MTITNRCILFSLAALSALPCAGGAESQFPPQRHILAIDSAGYARYPDLWVEKGPQAREKTIKWNGEKVAVTEYFPAKYGVDLRTFKEVARRPLRKEGVAGEPTGRFARFASGEGFDYDRAFGQYLDEMKAAFKASGKIRLLIVIHGGMNFINDAAKNAAQVAPAIQCQSKDTFPVFICWDSNPFSTYGDEITWVRGGVHNRQRGPGPTIYSLLSLPLHAAGDIGRGLARAPAVLAQRAVHDFSTLTPRWQPSYTEVSRRIGHEYYRGEEAGQRREWDASRGRGSGTISEGGGPGIGYSVGEIRTDTFDQIARPSLYWLLLPTKIATVPLLEGIGRPAWDNMNRRVQLMFRPDPETELPYRHNRHGETGERWHLSEEQQVRFARERKGYRRPSGALGVFLDELKDFRTSGGGRAKIDLFGHSMGAIVINELFRNVNLDQASGRMVSCFDNIVFAAAACPVRDFEATTLLYLIRNEQSRFYNLSLHPFAEAREIPAGGYLDLPIRGSLLQWIDDFYNAPQMVMDRTYGQFETAVQTSHIIPDGVRGRVVFNAFSAGNRVADPQGPQIHGSFKDRMGEQKLGDKSAEKLFVKAPAKKHRGVPFFSKEFWGKPE